MSKFIKYYDGTQNFGFNKILPAGGGEYYALGSEVLSSDSLMFAKIDANGNILFSKRHTLAGDTFHIADATLAPNGEIVACGIKTIAGSSNTEKLMMRFFPNGDLKWAVKYPETPPSNSLSEPRIVHLGSDKYMAVWTKDIGRLVAMVMDGNGVALNSKQIFSSSGTITHASITLAGSNCVIMATYLDATLTQKYVVITLDNSLSAISAVSFTNPYVTGALAVYPTGTKKYLVAAPYVESGMVKRTAILEINLNTNTATGRKINGTPWNLDPPSQKILLVNNNYYVLQMHAWTHCVMKLNLALDVQWIRYFALPLAGGPFDMDWVASPTNEFVFAGFNVPNVMEWQGLFARTNEDLVTCMTQQVPQPAVTNLSFSLTNFALSTAPAPPFTTIAITSNFSTLVESPAVIKDCMCGLLNYDPNALFQSPHVYLQSSGSDASDGSVRGYHLRWDFRKLLGDSHLPKGNLAGGGSAAYPTSIGFNRADDFVKIYKSPYLNRYPVKANLTTVPSVLIESGPTREWRYNGLMAIASLASQTTNVFIRFADVALYDALRINHNPNTNPAGFIKDYAGILEVGAVGKPSFKIKPLLAFTGGGVSIKHEAISMPDDTDPNSRTIASRGKWIMATPMDAVEAENIEYLRFTYSGAFPKYIEFETYQDYIAGANYDCTWSELGKFCLDDGQSDQNAHVFKQLEDTTNWQIDNKWPKYNQVSPSGEFKVKAQNYHAKWSLPNNGLQTAVVEYLTLSQTDLQAVKTLQNTDPLPLANSSTLEVSYLDLLHLVALDYHAARMLGMGYVHGRLGAQTSDMYVYLMEYVTEAALKDGDPPAFVRHYYMAPPVSILDNKLPAVPTLDNPPTYGLEMDVLSGTPSAITDPNGYVPYDNIRFINLHRQKFRHEQPFESFFATSDLFNLYPESIPVTYGVEYRDDIAGPGNYVRPEILNDPSYTDAGGLAETTVIFETGTNPVFTHLERNEGIHHYALYSINWFSRPSLPSAEIVTDYTQFTKLNSLLPPLNFAVQLIQPELPRIFTTAAEQARLGAIVGTDKTLVRATFDWNHIHNAEYQVADKIEFFFRENPPLVVRGEIRSGSGTITVNTTMHTVEVQTKPYVIASMSPPLTVKPNILPADVARFIGGTFVANGKSFVISNIVSTVSGDDPTFVLAQIKVTESIDPDGDNVFSTIEYYESPLEGEIFFVVENLNEASSWDSQLVKELDIVPFLPVHTENVSYADGTTKMVTYGGMYGPATIEHIYDPDTNLPLNTITGYYWITYDSGIHLPSLTDPDTEFYVGSVRVSSWGLTEKKLLKVVSIDDSGASLKLVACDPDYLTDPIVPNVAGAYPGIDVNFHPSYRVYFYQDITGGNNFEEASIMPALNAGSKETYMSARSKDTTLAGYVSAMATPSVVLARELREPVPPGVPMGPLFATRPNFYGKATYTFDVQVDNPFSLIFYRANERKILDTLYKPETVALILQELASLDSPDALFFQDRWSDLVNLSIDGSYNFKEYVSGGWRFKMPDNPKYLIPHPDPSVQEKPFLMPLLNLNGTFTYFDTIVDANVTLNMVDIVKDAIDGAFLPLTEIPVLFSQLQAYTFATSGRAPLLRDSNSDLLAFPDNDPWPMAFRYEKDTVGNILQSNDVGYGNPSNTRLVRFTDFTLDGEAQNFYFYFAAELSNTLKVSDRSPVAGPIQLVNSGAAKPPKIKKIETVLRNEAIGTKPAIRFLLNEIVASEYIQKLDIYRTFDPTDALSVRTMHLAKTVDVSDTVLDDFDDLGYVPFGEPLYYRIVALREIKNERGNTEYVPSEPSNLAMTNIIDNLNPQPPQLVITYDSPVGSPLELPNVVFTWNKTAHNGTYYLYTLNAQGNWIKIFSVDPSIHLNAPSMTTPLSGTTLATSSLFKQNTDFETIYHRFRVDVENSAGLLNLVKKELTI
ncbi:MAG: hypothetical protein IPN95_23825 [Bacteroidetes bacterium]|nr:hypothetical protein [Bacteroidota bacterium]MBP6720691.1 hypothetical protein [Bacteroidia bacterium]MBP8073141.1 hypothetical protein [Bacteroidia bacterium]